MTLPKLRPTFTFDQERLEALRAIAPEAFADGRVNWEALREALGDYLEDEERDAEHFGLFWPGKRAARRLASIPSAGTLLPAPDEGVNEATTRHIFIEGDNLEVLKLLQKSYAGRVKMIYIDPPYNTGNDFIYSDDFTQPLEAYLRATGQADEMGRVLVTNTRASGRYHSSWLTMMYPRLRLARALLRDDGVIFVSIDDNEVHHLRMLMNEVFGEENFVAQVIVQTNPRGRTLDRYFAKTHEYILVYAKDLTEGGIYQVPKSEQALAEYNRQDKRGRYRELELRNRNPVFTRANRPNLFYTIFANPRTGEVALDPVWPDAIPVLPLNSKGEEGCWTWSRKKVQQNIEMLVARQVDTSAWRIFRKDYLPEEGATTKQKALWLDKDINHERGKEELGQLFGKTPFDFPKSVSLILKCLQVGTTANEEDLILDFFAGSCTTAHAVLQLNHEDSGNRRFIMVQLPEPTPPDSPARRAGFATIADIGKERIRRVIDRLEAERSSHLALSERETPEDLGFRVFKLGRSHYKAWQDYAGEDLEALQARFDAFETPLVEGWQPKCLLVEVMLIEGFPLDSAVERLSEFAANTVWRVSSDALAHRLYVCLDERVAEETIAALALSGDDLFICLDSALSDEAKVRLADGRRVKVI